MEKKKTQLKPGNKTSWVFYAIGGRGEGGRWEGGGGKKGRKVGGGKEGRKEGRRGQERRKVGESPVVRGWNTR